MEGLFFGCADTHLCTHARIFDHMLADTHMHTQQTHKHTISTKFNIYVNLMDMQYIRTHIHSKSIVHMISYVHMYINMGANSIIPHVSTDNLT